MRRRDKIIRANDTFFFPSPERVSVISIIHTRSREDMYHTRKLLTRGPFFFHNLNTRAPEFLRTTEDP